MAHSASGVERPSTTFRVRAIVLVGALFAAGADANAPSFSFSKDAAREQAQKDEEARRIAELVSVPCQQQLKDRKILLLLAEHTLTDLYASQDRYGPHIQAIESRLRSLGLRPYTQEQIRAQIAQAEIEAYFRNDPDAALAASQRLAADFVLRGDIATQTSVNRVVGIDEVAVNLDLRLFDARNGRVLSEASARSESFSGSDTLSTAFALVQDQADPLVARIYNDFCQHAG
jgi:hypothetical protein